MNINFDMLGDLGTKLEEGLPLEAPADNAAGVAGEAANDEEE